MSFPSKVYFCRTLKRLWCWISDVYHKCSQRVPTMVCNIQHCQYSVLHPSLYSENENTTFRELLFSRHQVKKPTLLSSMEGVNPNLVFETLCFYFRIQRRIMSRKVAMPDEHSSSSLHVRYISNNIVSDLQDSPHFSLWHLLLSAN